MNRISREQIGVVCPTWHKILHELFEGKNFVLIRWDTLYRLLKIAKKHDIYYLEALRDLRRVLFTSEAYTVARANMKAEGLILLGKKAQMRRTLLGLKSL